MASEPTISKRLIISGLNQSFDEKILTQRLSNFGKVHSLTGLGTLNVVGQPRKFAHFTLEATKSQLTRCMNSFSGSTWKGAKLRVGEAKPDFHQRQVSELMEEDVPKRRIKTAKELRLEKKLKKRAKRSTKAKYSSDMSQVTFANYLRHKSWKLEPDGRLVRVVNMRPQHPISLPSSKATSSVKTTKSATKISVKAKLKRLIRLRATVLDSSRYGARRLEISKGSVARTVEHAQNVWDLEAWAREGDAKRPKPASEPAANLIQQPRESVDSAPDVPNLSIPSPIPEIAGVLAHQGPLPNALSSIQQLPSSPQHAMSTQLSEESKRSLALAKSLLKQGFTFDLDDVEGIDANERSFAVRGVSLSESSSSTSDPGNVREDSSEEDEEEGEEIMDAQVQATSNDTPIAPGDGPDSESDASSMDLDEPKIAKTTLDAAAQPQSTAKSLKALFAPREEEAGFSLFGNLAASGLDLNDLELEDDEAYGYAEPSAHLPDSSILKTQLDLPSSAAEVVHSQFSTTRNRERDDAIIFDPSVPLMFAVPPRLRGEHFGGGKKGARPKDLFDVCQERGWTGGFWRSATDEEIHQRWEDVKGDLTRSFKKRHREAVKRKRRGFGGAGMVEKDE